MNLSDNVLIKAKDAVHKFASVHKHTHIQAHECIEARATFGRSPFHGGQGDT